MTKILTRRECEVLRVVADYLIKDLPIKNTADALKISYKTLDVHLTNARRKLGYHSTWTMIYHFLKQNEKLS